mmetsp:Transcript_14008/g.33968  ORF Transcript_14008/g.33968 Transcript_14008/m.33968 type:complete len:337 (-) Transcript_14008:1137-2147(-)
MQRRGVRHDQTVRSEERPGGVPIRDGLMISFRHDVAAGRGCAAVADNFAPRLGPTFVFCLGPADEGFELGAHQLRRERGVNPLSGRLGFISSTQYSRSIFCSDCDVLIVELHQGICDTFHVGQRQLVQPLRRLDHLSRHDRTPQPGVISHGSVVRRDHGRAHSLALNNIHPKSLHLARVEAYRGPRFIGSHDLRSVLRDVYGIGVPGQTRGVQETMEQVTIRQDHGRGLAITVHVGFDDVAFHGVNQEVHLGCAHARGSIIHCYLTVLSAVNFVVQSNECLNGRVPPLAIVVLVVVAALHQHHEGVVINPWPLVSISTRHRCCGVIFLVHPASRCK